MSSQKPKYHTWIRRRRVALFGFVLLGLVVASALLWSYWAISLILLALAIPFAYIVYVLAYTYYQFSPIGNDYQSKIHDLIVNNIPPESGRLLDIGAGSGSLIIRTAKALPHIQATGIDSWASSWDYSKQLCEENARIEGVADRVSFLHASASRLPFDDSSFDVVVSCLTFHEVRDESDKTKVLQEALRVLKPGGEFVFIDLFLDRNVFGDLAELTEKLGVSKVDTIKLEELIELPRLLLSNRSLGNAVLMKGAK